MKLDVLNDSLSTTDVSKMSVNVDNLTYSLMIDGIYTNKLSSVIRELCTNARDSHIDANNSDPFLITINYSDTSSGGIHLSIKDFGTGLSKEEAETYLCNLNASSKRESDDVVGCFGIGSKSPFSLVDAYDFKCIKDGILTDLNLFRIKSETPRFLSSTSETSEANSVECIIKLEDYSLTEILKNIYIELALFDIKPNIHVKSETVDVFIEAEDFFCVVVEEEQYYHLFYKECLDEKYECIYLNRNLSSFFIDLKNTKKISCGIIGYKSSYIYTHNTYISYSDHNNPDKSLSDFYILKFGLDSDIKFDVSRENINEDSKTQDLLVSKILSDTDSLDLQEFVKLAVLIQVFGSVPYRSSVILQRNLRDLVSNINPEFLDELDQNLYVTQDLTEDERSIQNFFRFNKMVDYNYLFLKLEESLTYYRSNLKELGTIAFINKCKIRAFKSTKDDLKSQFLNYFISNSSSNLSLNFLSVVEKLILDTTVIWEELYLKNIIPNYSSDFNFLEHIFIYTFVDKYVGSSSSGTDKVRFKAHSFLPNTIKDLSNYKIDLIPNFKRLKSQTDLTVVKNGYKSLSSCQNKSVYLLNTNKNSLIDKELDLNLHAFNTRSCITIHDFDSYEELNPNFIKTVKYKAPPRLVTPASVTTSNASSEVMTHNASGVRLRNKLVINKESFDFNPDGRSSLDTTSLKFYEFLNKNYTTSSYNFRSLILVSKDIIKTEEEKKSILSIERNLNLQHYSFIFEIDNLESYEEIKSICSIHLDNLKYDTNRSPIIELNANFSDEEILKEYSRILIWMYTKNINFKSFENFLNSIEETEESLLLSADSEDDIKNFNYYSNIPSSTTLCKKVVSFSSKLDISINNPYSSYYYTDSSDNRDLAFKGISYLLNESLKDLENLSLKNCNYSKKCFYTSYHYRDSKFFDRLLDNSAATIDIILCINDSLMYKRIFNQEYLKFIEDNYNKPLITFNTENFNNLLKEY